MKLAIALVAILGVASAQPVQPEFRAVPTPSPLPVLNRAVVNNEAAASIVRYVDDINPDGSFNFGFETDNGIAVQEQGVPRVFQTNPPVAPVVVQGGYSYTSPEGAPIAITYIADENGYQPSGDSIPTPPPIPPYILRALEFIARNAPAVNPAIQSIQTIQKK